jgi:hypothetical protein
MARIMGIYHMNYNLSEWKVTCSLHLGQKGTVGPYENSKWLLRIAGRRRQEAPFIYQDEGQ